MALTPSLRSGSTPGPINFPVFMEIACSAMKMVPMVFPQASPGHAARECTTKENAEATGKYRLREEVTRWLPKSCREKSIQDKRITARVENFRLSGKNHRYLLDRRSCQDLKLYILAEIFNLGFGLLVSSMAALSG